MLWIPEAPALMGTSRQACCCCMLTSCMLSILQQEGSFTTESMRLIERWKAENDKSYLPKDVTTAAAAAAAAAPDGPPVLRPNSVWFPPCNCRRTTEEKCGP